MSDVTTPATVPQAQTSNPAQEAATNPPAPTAADRELAAQLYAGDPEISGDAELLGYAAEQVAIFRVQEGRLPRSAAELDAWSNSLEEYAAFLKANPVPAAAEQTAQQTQQAQADAEEAEQEAREEAEQTRKAAVLAFRKGEKAYRNGLLEAGRLASLYVQQRLALGDKRAAAVQTLEGELAKYSSTAVDANRLIACWEAYALLAVDTGLATAAEGKKAAPADSVPYGHYRDAWSRLVQRAAKDTPEEHWVLLPGLEADCLAAYAKAVQDGLSKAAVEEMARTLVTHAEAAAAEKARQAKAEAEAKAKAAEAAAAKQRQELAQQKAAADQAAKEAADAEKAGQTAEQKAQLTANMEQARQELLAKQQATIAAEAAEAAAKAEQARKEREAKEAADKAAAAAAKKQAAERKAAEKASGKDKPAPTPATVDPTSKPAVQPEAKPVMGNLIQAAKAAAKAATGKDGAQFVAENAAELITGCEEPDTALEALLTILAAHKEVSKAGHRACQAALVVLKRQESPSPSRVAEVLKPATVDTSAVNGQHTPAAA